MELSIFLAKVLGSYFLIAGIAMLTQRHAFRELVKESAAHFYAQYIFSFFVLILGLLLVFSHNLWVADWRVLITLIGWVTLFKGIFWIFFSDTARKYFIFWQNHPVFKNFTILLILLMGFYLIYHGFLFA